jgi:hypothetical protein
MINILCLFSLKSLPGYKSHLETAARHWFSICITLLAECAHTYMFSNFILGTTYYTSRSSGSSPAS